MPTPIDFKKLFKDVTKYPDTLKLKLGEDEIELGVLRAWNTENEGALVKELEGQRTALAGESAKVDAARKEVAAMYLDLQDQKSKLGQAPEKKTDADPYADLRDDPIVGALSRLVKANADAHTADIKAIREENKKVLDAIGKMGVTYMNDRARMDHASLTSDPDYDAKDTNLSMEKLYESAVKNGYRDSAGIPDVRRAYKDATADKRQARLVTEARADERKKLLEEQRHQAILPKPSGPRPVGTEAPQFKDLDGALAAAMQDQSIWGQA